MKRITMFIGEHEVPSVIYSQTLKELGQMARERLCTIEELDFDTVQATIAEIACEDAEHAREHFAELAADDRKLEK